MKQILEKEPWKVLKSFGLSVTFFYGNPAITYYYQQNNISKQN